MALLCTPAPAFYGRGRASLVTIRCVNCKAALVLAANGDRLRRLVPKLERVHRCDGC